MGNREGYTGQNHVKNKKIQEIPVLQFPTIKALSKIFKYLDALTIFFFKQRNLGQRRNYKEN